MSLTNNFLLSIGKECKIWRNVNNQADAGAIPDYICTETLKIDPGSELIHGTWGTNAGTHKLVKVYDRVNNIVSESYEPTPYRITALSVSRDEHNALMAVGTVSGDVLVIDRQHKEKVQLLTPFTKAVTCLEFSSQTKSLLVAGSADGRVAYWHVEEGLDPIEKFAAHTDTVTALALSPINRIAVLSAGLDGQLVLYDLTAQRIVRQFARPHAFTCMAYKNDGKTVALGTVRGEVVLFNLKTFTETTLLASGADPHPVRALSFQNSLDRRRASYNKQKKAPATPLIEPSGLHADAVAKRNHLPISTPKRRSVLEDGTPRQAYTPDPYPRTPTVQTTPHEPLLSSTPSLYAASPSIRSDRLHLQVFSPVKPSMDPAPPLSKEDQRASSAYVSPPIQSALQSSPPPGPSPGMMAASAPAKRRSLDLSPAKDMGLQDLVALSTSPSKYTVNRTSRPDPPTPKRSVDPQAFSETVLLNALEDRLTEHTDILRNDLQNIHLEILRQFEFQRLEMEAMLHRNNATMSDLIAENEKLRKELNRFRGYY